MINTQYYIKGLSYNTDFVFSSKEELRMWIDGAKHALYTFAHWKDGVMYVGSSGETYKKVIEELYANYKIATGKDYEEDYD